MKAFAVIIFSLLWTTWGAVRGRSIISPYMNFEVIRCKQMIQKALMYVRNHKFKICISKESNKSLKKFNSQIKESNDQIDLFERELSFSIDVLMLIFAGCPKYWAEWSLVCKSWNSAFRRSFDLNFPDSSHLYDFFLEIYDPKLYPRVHFRLCQQAINSSGYFKDTEDAERVRFLMFSFDKNPELIEFVDWQLSLKDPLVNIRSFLITLARWNRMTVDPSLIVQVHRIICGLPEHMKMANRGISLSKRTALNLLTDFSSTVFNSCLLQSKFTPLNFIGFTISFKKILNSVKSVLWRRQSKFHDQVTQLYDMKVVEALTLLCVLLPSAEIHLTTGLSINESIMITSAIVSTVLNLYELYVWSNTDIARLVRDF